MTTYQVIATEEERAAFDKAFEVEKFTDEQYHRVMPLILPAFLVGYRKGREDSKPNKEQAQAKERLAIMLGYPNMWDTAAYPNLEMAAIEALATKEADKKSFYTMDQMRDYAAAILTTRTYVIVEALETGIAELEDRSRRAHADGNPNSGGIYYTISNELKGIVDRVKTLGSNPFQKRALSWAKRCFGIKLVTDIGERNQRFIEEALELVQACGLTRREALGAVNYVYGRPVGDKRQEVGGVYTTLAILCSAHNIDMVNEGERDLREIDNAETTKRIRMKREGKPDFGGEVAPLGKQQFIDSLEPGFRPTLTYSGGTLNATGELVYEIVKKALLS
jgi:NTP pyrophosphatase (non-canonical NTP hydrolase)